MDVCVLQLVGRSPGHLVRDAMFVYYLWEWQHYSGLPLWRTIIWFYCGLEIVGSRYKRALTLSKLASNLPPNHIYQGNKTRGQYRAALGSNYPSTIKSVCGPVPSTDPINRWPFGQFTADQRPSRPMPRPRQSATTLIITTPPHFLGHFLIQLVNYPTSPVIYFHTTIPIYHYGPIKTFLYPAIHTKTPRSRSRNDTQQDVSRLRLMRDISGGGFIYSRMRGFPIRKGSRVARITSHFVAAAFQQLPANWNWSSGLV